MDTKTRPIHIYAFYRRPSSNLGTYRLKVRGWKKVFHTNKNQKKAGIAILILNKIDIKIKVATRDRERHYIMIMGSSKRKM